MPLKRPFSVTLLVWMGLSLSAWGMIRLAAVLRWWDMLSEFDASLSPLYLSITGAGWGAAGCVLLYGILSKRTWARPAIITSILLWLIEYWGERIFFQSARANLLFTLICSIIIMTATWLLTRLSSTISFFIKSEEYEQPNQTPNFE